jgi:hypothetical protein
MPPWQRLLQLATHVWPTVSQHVPAHVFPLQHAWFGSPHDWQLPPLHTVPMVVHWLPAATQVPASPVQQLPASPVQLRDAQQISVVPPHAVHVPPEHT